MSPPIPRKERRTPLYRYGSRSPVSSKPINLNSIHIVAADIVKNNLSPYQRSLYAINDSGNLDIATLVKFIKYNQPKDMRANIINKATEISDVKLFYGDRKVRIESDGSIMAIILTLTGYSSNIYNNIKGWRLKSGRNKIIMYTTGDNLISGDVTILRYNSPVKITRATFIGVEETKKTAIIRIEGIDSWEYLKGNYETMTSVHWEKYKALY